MCGIAGILHFGNIPDAPRRVTNMATSMTHRGPDDDGFWSDHDVALGFRRLSIVDIETGSQPMGNEDGRVQVVFNGEIYNHRELRRELEASGHRFSTDHSDTEILVHGYEEWGTDLPARLNGMFAFAVWDSRNREILIARDRLGIKPLHFGRFSNVLVFASDIRALHRSDLIRSAPDPSGVFEYFQQQNVWEERSMFLNVRNLRPGCWIRWTPEQRMEGRFWDVSFSRRRHPIGQAAEQLRETIQGSLRRQIAADVPVAAYLSGGIDSSAIAAGAYKLDSNIRAYTCIFDLQNVGADRVVDEREFARRVASYLNIEHIEVELPADDMKRSLAPTVSSLEEPRMGMAYVNYRIAERVSKDGKVVLSGCGGDEILAGYVGRYKVARDRMLGTREFRSFLAKVRDKFSRDNPKPEDVLDAILPMFSYPIAHEDLSRAFTPEFRRCAGDYSLRDGLSSIISQTSHRNVWDALMYADLKTYLPGLLVVEDKLSMAHGLETRVPLLDNEIIDLAFGFDFELLTDGATGKKVFREAIRDWVPEEIADKPKMGFGPPDASWYRGELQSFIRYVLDPKRISQRGVFQPAYVSEMIEDHMSGRANRLPFIWSILSFEAWCEEFGFYGGGLGDFRTRPPH